MISTTCWKQVRHVNVRIGRIPRFLYILLIHQIPFSQTLYGYIVFHPLRIYLGRLENRLSPFRAHNTTYKCVIFAILFAINVWILCTRTRYIYTFNTSVNRCVSWRKRKLTQCQVVRRSAAVAECSRRHCIYSCGRSSLFILCRRWFFFFQFFLIL